jgi:hypothetical protein
MNVSSFIDNWGSSNNSSSSLYLRLSCMMSLSNKLCSRN